MSLHGIRGFHARTKHIKVDYHFIHEKKFNKDIQALYISTTAQSSDIFTKGLLTSTRFLLLKDKLMLRDLPSHVRDLCPKKDVKAVAANLSL